nr:MAG TPA: hypothetical protein [Caudoviricetes sp.]
MPKFDNISRKKINLRSRICVIKTKGSNRNEERIFKRART